MNPMVTICLVAFSIIVFLLLLYAYKSTGTLFNIFTIFTAPYFILIPLNQVIATSYFGMYSIKDEVILMVLGAIVSFFIGCLPLLKPIGVESNVGGNNASFDLYCMKPMVKTVLLIGLALAVQIAVSIVGGSFDIDDFDNSAEAFAEGPMGHLRLIGYVLTPIVMLWGINKKDRLALLGVVLMLIGTFATFKKNYIFCMIITLLIFTGIYQPKLSKRLIVAVAAAVPILFFANYFIGFYLRDSASSVSDSFYITRFFIYSTGSLVYDNNIFEAGIRVGSTLIDKCLTFIFALPNMFLNRLFGVRLFEHETQAFLPLSDSGQTGNVVDFIGYMYPSHGNAFDVLGFLFFFLLLGFFAAAFINFLINRNKSGFSVAAAIFLSEFVFFSFFGTFYINATPWESLLLAGIMLWLFKRKTWRGIIADDKKEVRSINVACGNHDVSRIA